MGKKGFTLIELIMVIIILGILAIVAIPRFFNLQTRAMEGAVDGVVGSVRSGIHMYYGSNTAWPPTGGLEDPADLPETTVFEEILEQGIDVASGGVGWTRVTDTYTYTYPGAAPDGGTEVFVYSPGPGGDGSFTNDGTGTHVR